MSICIFFYRQLSTAFILAIHSTGRLVGNGMRHLAIISRGLRGRTTPFYLVFAFPLNRSLFVTIVLYIADEPRRIHRGHRQSCLVLYIFVSPDIAVSHG